MPLLESTKTIQNNLGKYCQTGDTDIPIEGARKERLPHYRRLVFNVILDSLNSAFPLTKRLLGEERFEDLCNTFFKVHACQEPQVYRMTGEFARYVQRTETFLFDEYPFIGELLEFEWTEMDMYMMEDHSINEDVRATGDWLHDTIALNPESRLLQFNYPVFKKKPSEISDSDQALYYCYAYRQPENGRIMFLDLSPLMAVIISQIADRQALSGILESLKNEGVEINHEQQNHIISFLKKEALSGFSLGFYT